MKHYIGIHGKARSGKDTIAKHLVKQYGYTRYAFADPLKRIVNKIFDWEYAHAHGSLKDVIDPAWGFSPRRAYQLFGTEFARALSSDFWLKMAEREIPRALSTSPGSEELIVVPDVRFENEAEWIRKRGALFIVNRDFAEPVHEHESENGIMAKPEDITIGNNGSIDDLTGWIDLIMDTIARKDAA
jgi:hypothetical protein